MSEQFDLVLKGGQVITSNSEGRAQPPIDADIGIVQGKIAKIGSIEPSAAKQILKADGMVVVPGMIDTQVHFRDPGYPQKEDIGTGTLSALLGGVTTVFDMPNTNPPTVSALDLADKVSRAKAKAWCHIGFYIGATAENISKLAQLETLPGAIGIKVFVGSSTGNLLLTDFDKIAELMKSTKRPIAFHSEDDSLLRERKSIVTSSPGKPELHPEWRSEEVALTSTKKLVELAEKYKRRIHILHVSSKAEMEFLKDHKSYVTVEATPQHLTLIAPDCYQKLGTLAQMNPPIRTLEHRQAIWQGVDNETVDVLGSDHAPHTLEEKKLVYPESPSGMPGVQTIFPIMLYHYSMGRIRLERIVDLLAHNPAKIFKLKSKGFIREGYDADLTLINLKSEMTIENKNMATKVGWTPFDGMKFIGAPKVVLLRGEIVVRDGQTIGGPRGKIVEIQNN